MTKDPDGILVYDVSGISKENLSDLEKELREVADKSFAESMQLIRDGRFFGCVHDHFAIAVASYNADDSCGECGRNQPPDKKERH